MKINRITSTAYNNSFKGVKAANSSVPNEILGKKKDIIDIVSDAKDVDVWTFKFTSGGMFNPSARYLVMFKDKNAKTIKEISSTDSTEDKEKLCSKIESSVIWAHAPMNFFAIDALRESEAAKNYPDYASKMSSDLLKAKMSSEAKLWETKLEII